MAEFWHVMMNGAQQGPLSEEAVLQLLRAKSLTGKDFCWTDGFANWVTMDQVPQFAALLKPAAAATFEGVLQGGWGVLKGTLERGKHGALRTMNSAKLRMQIAQIQKDRDRLCMALGAEVFVCRQEMELSDSMREKIDRIAAYDDQISAIDAQATAIEDDKTNA